MSHPDFAFGGVQPTGCFNALCILYQKPGMQRQQAVPGCGFIYKIGDLSAGCWSKFIRLQCHTAACLSYQIRPYQDKLLCCALCIPACATADGPLKLFGEQASYQKIAEEMESLDGVITHGLFVNVASTAAVFTSEGVDLIESAAFVS